MLVRVNCWGNKEMLNGVIKKAALIFCALFLSMVLVNIRVQANSQGQVVEYAALQKAVSAQAVEHYQKLKAYQKATDDGKQELNQALIDGREVLSRRASQKDVDAALNRINICLNNLGGQPESLPHTSNAITPKRIYMSLLWCVITIGAACTAVLGIVVQVRNNKRV